MPSESGEKVTLGISALLSMTVFLMTIRESLPPTEKTPLISEKKTQILCLYDFVKLFLAMYYGVSICLVSFASAMAVVTLNVHFRGLRGAEVPALIKKIFLRGLARIVFMQFDPGLELAAGEPCCAAEHRAGDTFEQRVRVSMIVMCHVQGVPLTCGVPCTGCSTNMWCVAELFQVQHHAQ